MPDGTTYKYEVDKSTGDLVLDRPLKLQVPFNYGYVPNTLSEDGDPLDIFVASNHSIPSKTRVKAFLLGVFRCIDNGQEDDKLVAVLSGEETGVDNETKEGIKNFIKYYLENYKEGFQVISYGDALEAQKVFQKSVSG